MWERNHVKNIFSLYLCDEGLVEFDVPDDQDGGKRSLVRWEFSV